MKAVLKITPLSVLTLYGASLFFGVSASGQHPPEHSAHQMTPGANTTTINPHGTEAQTVEETLAGRPPMPTNLYPRKD